MYVYTYIYIYTERERERDGITFRSVGCQIMISSCLPPKPASTWLWGTSRDFLKFMDVDISVCILQYCFCAIVDVFCILHISAF